MSTLTELFPPSTSTWTSDNIPDLSGKVFIVTGGNSGIGRETVLALLKHNGRVYMASRSRDRAEEVIAELKEETGHTAIFLELDLANLASVKKSAEEYMSKETRLNTLFNSGGVLSPPIDQLTSDGYDLQFGTNALGHFYFTKLLLPILLHTYEATPTEKPRVVTTSGGAYKMYPTINYETLRDGKARRKLSGNQLYAQSKLGNIYMSTELAKRYQDKLVAITLHPGVFRSGLQRNMYMPQYGPIKWALDWFFQPVSMAAFTQLFAGTAPEAAEMNGKYLIPWAREGRLSKEASDSKEAEKLWAWFEEQIAGAV